MKNSIFLIEKTPTLFLRLVIYALGLIVLGLCLIALPLGLASDNTGYYKPILIGLYIPAIPYFIALFQAVKLLDNIDSKQAFSESSVGAFKKIKLCALFISAMFLIGSPYVFYAADRDDAPGVLLVDLIILGISFVVAVFAAVMQKLFQTAVDIKAENDLTV